MKKFNPPINQIVLGASWKEYECPEWVEAFLNYIEKELDRVMWNNNQETYSSPFGNTGNSFKNNVFEVRAYYWGDCTCGWSDFEFDEPHDDTCYQSIVNNELLEKHGFIRDEDGYLEYPNGMGYDEVEEIKDAVRKKYCEQFNLSFPAGCAVHCICTHEDRFAKWFEENKKGPQGHAVNCPVQLPNFKWNDVEISWYKYSGRGMSINQEIMPVKGIKMLNECLESIRKMERKVKI